MVKKVIYKQIGLPVFQNKVYPTAALAKLALTGDVHLVQCETTGLVHNAKFDSTLLDYDKDYQNEQACSLAFQQHLEIVMRLILSNVIPNGTGIEIGCGKGYFLEMMINAGANITGYDPAYEGLNPRVVKEYFGFNETQETPDYIILRHVLEHIPSPWSFLEGLAKRCKPGTMIYIEVPCFDWIVKNNAFYDVFYEHVNYFTLSVLKQAFNNVLQSGRIFGEQYIYIIAELSSFGRQSQYSGKRFDSLEIDTHLDTLLTRRLTPSRDFFIWGAGAKGMIFSNILQKKALLAAAMIDINPAKQGRFSGLSGVPIVSPSEAFPRLDGADVFVMNPVYLQEIKEMSGNREINWISVT